MRVDVRQSGGGKAQAELKRRQRAAADSDVTIEVGYFPESRYEEDNMPVAQIALVNDLGLGPIPERNFFRMALERNKKHWDETTSDRNLEDGAVSQGALADFQTKAPNEIRNAIVTGAWQINARATLRDKDAKQPLQDTGQLLREAKAKRA